MTVLFSQTGKMMREEREHNKSAQGKAVNNDSFFCVKRGCDNIQTELLSPAGDPECLYAAAAAGADAVYAGADKFGARAYASNFDTEEYLHAIDYMHMLGKKLYLTLNTLVKEREFNEIYAFLKPFYAEGLDGVIVQDIGIIRYLREEFPSLPVHASTQMSVTTAYGADYLKSLGVQRVVTARELSVEEIRHIHEKTDIEIESFIHGAMCCSYSGQCLMSSFLGGRSGNRGRCAGPCRQPYSSGNMKDRYLLGLKDMCTIDIIPDIIGAGVCSFKIEGRMKSPDYVGGVTAIYRKYIDSFLENGKNGFRVGDDDRNRLIRLYSRGGLSTGYYERHNGLDMLTVDRSGYVRDETANADAMHERKRIPVSGRCTVISGAPMSLEVSSGGISVKVSTDIVQEAQKHPAEEKDIRKQIIKTGDTDFVFERLEIETDGRSFAAVSALNDLRRQALDNMMKRLICDHKRTV